MFILERIECLLLGLVLLFSTMDPFAAKSPESAAQKPAGAGILFLNSTAQVLLLLRDDKPTIPFPNCWDIPGGMIDPGETAEECVVREMREEIGKRISRPQLFRVYHQPKQIDHVFWQRADIDIAQVKLTEGQRLKWFSLDEIKAMEDSAFAFGFKRVLLDFFEEKPWSSSPSTKS
jgi:8-oxo-dGTP diphosphatase